MCIKKVLCPVDFNAVSEQALDYAVSLACSYHSELCLLYIVDRNTLQGENLSSDEINGIKRELEKRALKHLSSLVIQTDDSLKIEACVSIGEPFITALEFARTKEVDLIVLNKPKSAKRKATRSNHPNQTMEAFLKSAACPVPISGKRLTKSRRLKAREPN